MAKTIILCLIFFCYFGPTTAGVWTEWALLNKCNKNCGGGMEHLRRDCVETEESPGERCADGNAMKVMDIKIEACNMHACGCPVDLSVCKYGTWTMWTNCTKYCGFGYRTRTRHRGGACWCIGESSQEESCNLPKCPVWHEWIPWSLCHANCGRLNKGLKKRKRICSADRKEMDRLCELGENCTTFDSCANEQMECGVSAEEYKYKCEKRQYASGPKELTATLQYAVNTMGSAFIMAICVIEIALFVLMWVFPTQRLFHLPQELCLLAGHLGLCFILKLSDNDLTCYIVIGYINFTFMSYFCFLCLECLHVMAFLSHTIRKGTLFPIAVQYLLVLAVSGGITATYILVFRNHMFLTAEDRRLCWIFNDGCKLVVNEENTKSKVLISPECPYPSRIFFIIHFALFALSFVFLESGMNLRRQYPDSIPSTNIAQLRDAEFAYTGLYLQILLSYLSLIFTLGAFYYQVATPTSHTIFVWSTAALASDVALGICIFVYHSFGVAKVRNIIMKFKYKLTTLCCGCCIGPIKPPNMIEEEE